ncbi:MAG: DUF3108 domain-containing protein [Bacteroidota bacterium]
MNRKMLRSSVAFLLVLMLMGFRYVPKENGVEPVVVPEAMRNTCSIENQSFQGGEEIVYKLYYNWNFVWLAAGEVVFKVNDAGNQYHVSAVGKTYSSYEWFYKVHDVYESYLNKHTLLPETSIRDVHEGKYTLYDKIDFDQQSGRAVSLRGKNRSEAERKEHEVENCMHDILSIIYYARNLNFDNMTTGTEVPIKIFMDEEMWPLKFTYNGREANKKIKGRGRYNTIKFSPQVIKGDLFQDDSSTHIWVSDDKNRIPLLIESPLSVGSVKAVLKQHNGLRYEVTSKVK